MSTSSSALSDVLFGQIRGRVLGWLYGHADESFYVRQIARQVDTSVGAVQRELEKLAKVGLIVRNSVGNQVFYKVNQRNPVFAEMRALVGKTVGVFNILHSALEPLSERIRVAFVYGSMARQEETPESDIDVMMIGEVKLEEVLSHFAEAERVIGRPVNPTIYSVREFKGKLQSGNHFLTAVLGGKKIFLIGSEDELREMGGVRMGKVGAQQPKRNQRSAGNRTA